ncbi:ABC transporter substrate-binding protein [Taylorella equigenitalis]|uniref:Leucine-, isoleucine-, valine-, threonine-, and alanine-binding protein n=1 Tax=Taylorella equigenitalis (strain MCE9) TaxID=937774 RepID=A0A654KF62_TAYEM|nr:ABC transporter substrate-binding protein [Taylorella equigenitalis]ADU91015.1 Leucine-, isoleucine-, valine-, threonine-, and alanine-binding protein [Taylorella equigenitalis MCE9]ASY41035.1 branched-chain amino acid ABC transporter substrate-binding protein [Taylorella equigenitalis]WDU45898.1 ABC transporter substrate-binding protein [Taylorella equigenitalis]WDU47432.1 ABC transporter substrate-binding protein [Taylorella equigenitalis]WDU48889.1 ABC transporter substrate-binding prote
MKSFMKRLSITAVMLTPLAVSAEVTVGVILSNTGPAAAIGIQSQNAINLWPKTVGGEPLRWLILDDGSDVSRSVKNVRKLINEDKVDVIVGPNLTSSALAYLETLAETKTPMIALAANSTIVEPQSDPNRTWAFKMPQNDTLMADVLVKDMLSRGYKKIGFIGYADAYGENWFKEFSKLSEGKLEIVAREAFQRTDTSVTAQVLKLIASNPEAVLIAGAGTPAILPQRALHERGYKGQIYQTHGIGTLEFLQIGGKVVENTLFPTGPGVVARTLPDSNEVKKVALDFTTKFEEVNGLNTTTQFAGDAYGAYMVLDGAVKRALDSGMKPGTVEFRTKLRDEIQNTKELTVPNGVLNISSKNHQGFDDRAAVMGTIKDGKFVFGGTQ